VCSRGHQCDHPVQRTKFIPEVPSHTNLTWLLALIRLCSRVSLPMAVYHHHLWCSCNLHDLGTSSRVCLIPVLSQPSSCSDRIRCVPRLPSYLNRQDKIIWECQNGGQLWGASEEAGYGTTAKFPEGICAPGWQSLFTAFIISLLVDLAFQMYMFFLNWRFMKRLQRYTNMKPYGGNYYQA